MTKAELIRKMSKRSGVPDSEAKIFFEIFLKRISVLLKPGEAIKINAFGYFQFRKAVVQSMLTTTAEKISTDYSDLIVFSPTEEDQSENIENLIFNIPSYLIENENYNQLDSYFSLSIGKPVIPLKDAKDSEYFIPPTSGELRKLIETKVEKLLQGAEVITKHTKGNEYLVIKPEMTINNQFELPWDDKTSAEKDKSYKKVEDKKSEQAAGFNHVAWNFGEDLSKQIEEESLLDVSPESEAKQNEEEENLEDVSWDFGVAGDEEKEKNEAVEENNNDNITDTPEEKENVKNDLPDEETKAEESETHITTDKFTTKEFEEKVAEDLEKYQRVKAMTREFTDEPVKEEPKEDMDWNFGDEESKIEESDNPINKNEEISDKELDRTFATDEVSLEEKDINDLFKDKEKTEDESVSEKENKDNKSPLSKDNSKTNEEKPFKNNSTGINTGKYSYGKRNSSAVFFIALVIILAVGAVLFIYLKNVNLKVNMTNNGTKGKVIQVSAPEIINRTFNIPVTYPYVKSDRKNGPAKSGISQSAIKTKASGSKPLVEKSNLSSLLNNTSTAVKKTPAKKESGKIKISHSANQSIEGNIYKSGNSYIVQVSSWRTKSIAERQVNRFKSAGYKAFIERAEVPGRGTWFRVRIGNFKSLAEAENFSKRFK